MKSITAKLPNALKAAQPPHKTNSKQKTGKQHDTTSTLAAKANVQFGSSAAHKRLSKS